MKQVSREQIIQEFKDSLGKTPLESTRSDHTQSVQINIEQYEIILKENHRIKKDVKETIANKDKEINVLNQKLDILSEKIVICNYIEKYDNGQLDNFIKDFKKLKEKYYRLKKTKISDNCNGNDELLDKIQNLESNNSKLSNQIHYLNNDLIKSNEELNISNSHLEKLKLN